MSSAQFAKITTAGAGTMGSQVAWQMAFHGKQVTVCDAMQPGPAGSPCTPAWTSPRTGVPSSNDCAAM